MKKSLQYKRTIERLVEVFPGKPEGSSIIANQTELRRAFWAEHPALRIYFREGKRHNAYRWEVRKAFVEWVNTLAAEGEIHKALAARVTL